MASPRHRLAWIPFVPLLAGARGGSPPDLGTIEPREPIRDMLATRVKLDPPFEDG
jgi:hypothetical protein